jgi:hypothetical protein
MVVNKNNMKEEAKNILIKKMQTCNNIFGDNILTEGQAKGCLIIAVNLVIDALENKDDLNWWKDFKDEVEKHNTTIII